MKICQSIFELFEKISEELMPAPTVLETALCIEVIRYCFRKLIYFRDNCGHVRLIYETLTYDMLVAGV